MSGGYLNCQRLQRGGRFERRHNVHDAIGCGAVLLELVDHFSDLVVDFGAHPANDELVLIGYGADLLEALLVVVLLAVGVSAVVADIPSNQF
jgi:hypothetical protein